MTQIDWSGILTITCVGFCLVIVMLLLLVFVMKGFGSFFTHQRKKAYSPWNSKIHGLTQMPDYRK